MGPSAAPPESHIIGIRGPDNLYRMKTKMEGEKHKQSAAPASAPVVKYVNLHNTINHSSVEKLSWFRKEYPNAIQNIRESANDERDSSWEACILGKTKRKPFVNLSNNRFAPVDAVSSDVVGPIFQ